MAIVNDGYQSGIRRLHFTWLGLILFYARIVDTSSSRLGGLVDILVIHFLSTSMSRLEAS
ncbi:hypothetical protein GCM10028819_44740 [Spirosoma humi]